MCCVPVWACFELACLGFRGNGRKAKGYVEIEKLFFQFRALISVFSQTIYLVKKSSRKTP